MLYISAFISLLFIVVTGFWLFRKNNPQGVLIVLGVIMLLLSMLMGLPYNPIEAITGLQVFDVFRKIENTFTLTLSRVGFMIMAIGGYVAYIKHIKASDALVYVSMKPLSLLKKYPYLAAVAIIPIGQMLFVSIPSAAGLGLLLVASVLPMLNSIGVSKLTGVSVITACTVFDMGPGSANTAKAAEVSNLNEVSYFLNYQIKMVVPMLIVLMILYYFTSRYYDKKDAEKGLETEPLADIQQLKVNVPLIYALLPILPIGLLLTFSKYFQLFSPSIELTTTTAIIISLFIAMLFELIRSRNISQLFDSLKTFWQGMGEVFSSVVTLIVCAEIFSQGLISLGFIEALVEISTHLGLSGGIITGLIATIIFFVATLMGSGNAAFFSFGPLIPDITKRFGYSVIDMVLPMQLSASMGRAVSPIAGVIIATAGVAGISPFELAKRNAIPLVGTLIFMLIYSQFV